MMQFQLPKTHTHMSERKIYPYYYVEEYGQVYGIYWFKRHEQNQSNQVVGFPFRVRVKDFHCVTIFVTLWTLNFENIKFSSSFHQVQRRFVGQIPSKLWRYMSVRKCQSLVDKYRITIRKGIRDSWSYIKAYRKLQ